MTWLVAMYYYSVTPSASHANNGFLSNCSSNQTVHYEVINLRPFYLFNIILYTACQITKNLPGWPHQKKTQQQQQQQNQQNKQQLKILTSLLQNYNIII